LTDAEIAAVWRATEAPGVYNAIVRVLLLTGLRRGEAAAATWGEFSADLAAWAIPGSRTKNHADHIVPLSKQVQAIIGAQPRFAGNPHVFTGDRGGSFRSFVRAKPVLDRASGVTEWTLHDLRRTCATGLQRLGVRLEVTEAVLNHVPGSRGGIVGVYQRHDWADEKRVALQAWGDRIEAIVEGRALDNVVTLRRF
jgi:integrase